MLARQSLVLILMWPLTLVLGLIDTLQHTILEEPLDYRARKETSPGLGFSTHFLALMYIVHMPTLFRQALGTHLGTLMSLRLLIGELCGCMTKVAIAGGEEHQDLLGLNQNNTDRGLLILRRFVVAGQASTTMLVQFFTLARQG